MKAERDYIRDIAEIRSMMERSSRFLSLAGWAGIMAGIYALIGVYVAMSVFYFDPDRADYSSLSVFPVAGLGLVVLILAVGTAIFLSYRKSLKRGERLWNSTSRRMVFHVSVPLVVGGFLMLIMISKGLLGLVAPLSLIFYGLALHHAGQFTYREIRALGIFQILLGLTAMVFLKFSLILWALGFGMLHIIYGIYIHYKYER